MDPDELSRLVYLHLQSGESAAELVASLAISEDDVWRLYAAGEALVKAMVDSPEWITARRAEGERARHLWDTPEQRRASALELLAGGGFVTVEAPDPDLGPEVSWIVTFDDVAGIEFADLVGLTIDRLGRLDGVDRVEADDRDLITVSGPLAREYLRQTVGQWWDHWLRGVIGETEPGG